MNREYPLSGTKIIMRRLFLHDISEILECYNDYNTLFYNPINKSFVHEVFLEGEFWGAFSQDKLISCCYYFPLKNSFFEGCNTYNLLCDFIPCPDKYLNMGYVGINQKGKEFLDNLSKEKSAYSGLYQSFLNIAEMQAFRRGFRCVLHYIPLKLTDNLSVLTEAGYRLIKMRGLDKLVVHYIFVKAVYSQDLCESNCTVAETIALNDTKKLSAYLEKDWQGCQIVSDKYDVFVVVKKSVTD